MELTITQKAEKEFFDGPNASCFTVNADNISFDITVRQMGTREITVSTASGSYHDMLSVYYDLETLLMLFDGQFYPVVKAFDGADITLSWNERRLPSYSSADFMIGRNNRLLDYDTVLNEQVFLNWCALRKELDIVHNMVLYCLSSVKMPKDMQCAFMVEAFKGVCELVSTKNKTFILPKVPKGESKLKYYFLAVAAKYGSVIFSEELRRDKDKFAQILVDSRNRIAHIRSRQGKTILNGEESVLYLIKLSLLYRVVLFDLLGIPQNVYQSTLSARIQKVNDHPAMKSFLNSL